MILHIIRRETAFSATKMIPNDKLNPSIRHRCTVCAMQFWESATVCEDKTQVGKRKEKNLQAPIPVRLSLFNLEYQTMLGYSGIYHVHHRWSECSYSWLSRRCLYIYWYIICLLAWAGLRAWSHTCKRQGRDSCLGNVGRTSSSQAFSLKKPLLYLSVCSVILLNWCHQRK